MELIVIETADGRPAAPQDTWEELKSAWKQLPSHRGGVVPGQLLPKAWRLIKRLG